MPPPSRADLWSAGKDESVQVNQRSLIDKILSRYSAEFTIFRELIQNADDAGAGHVQIKFYTQAGVDAQEHGSGRKVLPSHKEPIVRYVVCNDGIPFRPEDWDRLKKIAEGNPDDQKVGMYGVGFYSLWSVCDDPFVESGTKWMGFYWKDGKDQLHARSGDLPPSRQPSAEPTSTGHPWTSVTMGLRDHAPLEAPLDFARFLVTSLTFMRTIKHIDMVVDDIKVLEVRKDVTGKHSVSRPGLNNISSMGMMKVQGVDATTMVITARVMKWLSATGVVAPPLPPPATRPVATVGGLISSFFGRSTPSPAPPPPEPEAPPEDPNEVDVLAREIQIFQADIKVTVSSSFGKELERATKKSPPARMPASLVFSREDETATSADGAAISEKKAAAVFAGLCPPLDSEKSARVFIGQPTSQTTGIGGHLAARFIPTVERESIDLVDRHVSHWNKELLWVGGYLSRLIYELELINLQQLWAKTTATETAARAQILARGLHALRFFSFRPTTPSATVGQEMESAFFACGKQNNSMPLISTAGILRVDQVRVPNEQLQQFIPDLPVLTPATVKSAERAVGRLRERKLLREILFDDVVKALGERPLTEVEMVACLSWWQQIGTMEGYSIQARTRLLDAAVLVTDSGRVVPLGSVQTFVNPGPSHIPTDMPLPPTTLPTSVVKALKANQVLTIFGWAELSLPHYITFLVNPPMTGPGVAPETDICLSPAFSERVLGILGRAWNNLNGINQSAIVQALKDVPCIPTKAGYKKPGEAYFEKNLLFDDLPTIALPKTPTIKGNMEKMLLAIGVRRTVDLQLVFSRLVGGGTWTCLDLMKYLVSVKDTLSAGELARLKNTAAFPLEQSAKAGEADVPIIRRKPNQLYEPVDAMRSLGLPVLDWGAAKWRSNSDEAKMLFDLGLHRFPPVDVLLGIAAGPAPTSELALNYLLSNTHTHYPSFHPMSFSGVAFIPATTATGNPILAKPGEVFTNQACTLLGFSVARPPASNPENAAKLYIPTDPPMDRLVSALLHAPERDVSKARAIFEYLATRVGSASVSAISPLLTQSFIPVLEGGKVNFLRPDQVYFASKNERSSIYAFAFTFIDFGERANFFLKQCGVQDEPSHKDVARLFLREPDRMLKQAGSPSKYLEHLRVLAANMSTFDRQLVSSMKTTPFLLAYQRVPTQNEKQPVPDEDDYRKEYRLCKASDAVIIDNPMYKHFFGHHILAVPEEQILEKFYTTLGSQTLSSRVRSERVPFGLRAGTSDKAAATRRHVLQRLTIFLGNMSRQNSEYTAEWLAKGENFTVMEATDIKARYTYSHGKTTQQHTETLYASAHTQGRSKAVVLVISDSASRDWYDVANALCQVIIRNNRSEDGLVLESILSTSLQLLKKRGYNVDRILNQQREETLRLQAEKAYEREKAIKDEEKRMSTVSSATTLVAGRQETKPSATSAGQHPPLFDTKAPPSTTAPVAPPVPSGVGGLFGTLKKQFGRDSVKPTVQGGVGIPGGASGDAGLGQFKHASQGGVTTRRPTDQAALRRVVQNAVQASRPESGTSISDTKSQVKDVSESQSQYCDESAQADLRLAYNPGPSSCKLWLPNDQMAFEGNQREVCERFAEWILKDLAKVFGLEIAIINVFWDREGPLIAFNRGGTLWCNARYYAAWHDAEVLQANRTNALVSWYMSLAHEIAHNLESAHNASHEFYFSAIAEEHMPGLVPLLTST